MRALRLHMIIPALDEEECLPLVLSDLRALPLDLEEVIVIDNGSTDRTPELARAAGATVLLEPERGYGAACLRGLSYLSAKITARGDREDVVVFLDADHSDFTDDLPQLLEPIVQGRADFVVGSRLLLAESRKAVPPIARWGNSFAVSVLGLFYRQRFTDMGPFRAITWRALEHLQMRDRTWGWTLEMQLKALHCGVLWEEAPVRYRNRPFGRSKISQSLVGAVRAGSKILWVLGTHLLLTRKPGPFVQPRELSIEPVAPVRPLV